MTRYLILLLLFANVTMYGKTGNLTASGKYPFVGGCACPRNIHFGVLVEINGNTYICNDRTALRYNDRFDIFSTGTREEMMKFGKKKLLIQIIQ